MMENIAMISDINENGVYTVIKTKIFAEQNIEFDDQHDITSLQKIFLKDTSDHSINRLPLSMPIELQIYKEKDCCTRITSSDVVSSDIHANIKIDNNIQNESYLHIPYNMSSIRKDNSVDSNDSNPQPYFGLDNSLPQLDISEKSCLNEDISLKEIYSKEENRTDIYCDTTDNQINKHLKSLNIDYPNKNSSLTFRDSFVDDYQKANNKMEYINNVTINIHNTQNIEFSTADNLVESILNDDDEDEDDFSVEVRRSTSNLANGHIINLSSDFEEISLHSSNIPSSLDSQTTQTKSVSRLTNFLTKSVLRKISRSSVSSESSNSEDVIKQSSIHSCKNGDFSLPKTNIINQNNQVVRKSNMEVPSTTSLILLSRPDGLPCKNVDEELKHRALHEEMIESAKKKEQSYARMKRKRLQAQLKVEEARALATKVWNQEILPYWETMKNSKKTMDLWWLGIPPSVRGRVWYLAIGNDLNVTSELYEICLMRAKEKLKSMKDSDTDSLTSFSNDSSNNRESSVELIKLDVSRTFPQLCIFQKEGPYHEILQSLLGAYACHRPDVGYVQGMSFLAAVLLLNMTEVETFVCFANLLNKPCLVTFFRLDENMMKAYFETYQILFRENMRVLYQHFNVNHITPDLYIIDWMYTMFAKPLPLDVASRVWDVFCRDGEEFLFRTALGILRLYEDILLELDFIHVAQFLTRLPEIIPGDELFRCISLVRMNVDKFNFSQILQKHMPIGSQQISNNSSSSSHSSPINSHQTKIS